MLPARFDDSELPGLLPDVVAVDLRRYTPEQFADLVVAKLADLGYQPVTSRAGLGAEAAGRGAGGRGRPAAAGRACGDQRAGGAG